jgi:hypothetical protein
MSRKIGKGDEAAERLIMEVEALFEMDVVVRDCVEQAVVHATNPETREMTYEQFYEAASLSECRIGGQPVVTTDYTDGEGNPDGGWSEATGLSVRWQRGPLDMDDDVPWNGCFLVTVLEVARQRLEYYQQTKFKCADNSEALGHVEKAIEALNRRQVRRFCGGVRGTHEKD